jgi:hypothetical protein
MLHRRLLLVLSCWLLRHVLMAQIPDSLIIQPLTPMLERAFIAPKDLAIQLHTTTSEENIDIGVPMHTNHVYVLLKSGGTLYARISATGILYEIIPDWEKRLCRFRRVDVTTHFGYNINAFEYAYRGSLYNLGGYGYWRWNGQLRAFNHRMKEWVIIPLDREIPVATGSPMCNIWLDSSKGVIYSMGFIRGNEAQRNDPVRRDDSAFVLDLKTYEWKPIGIAPPILLAGGIHRQIAVSDSGLLINSGGNISFWNVKRNIQRTLVNDNLRATLLTMQGNKYIWFEGNKLLIGNAVRGTIDSLMVNHDDFVDTDSPVYIPFRSSSNLNTMLLGAVPLLAGVLWMVRRRYNKSSSKSKAGPPIPAASKQQEQLPVEEDALVQSSDAEELMVVGLEPFDAVEKSLLGLLIDHHQQHQRKTTTQEVNRILGVGNKTLDMQKRKRSDVIRAINRKYHLIHPDRSPELIIKLRSEMDGRLSEYHINPAELEMVRKYLV